MKKIIINATSLFNDDVNTYPWSKALYPVIARYSSRKHPLDYKNKYQLIVMVILSAQDSDAHINAIAPALFAAFPHISSLLRASDDDLLKHLSSVRNHGNKIHWLKELSQKIGDEKNIPHSLSELVELPGIGRKSANVIIRETGGQAEGVIVDLHVLRVAPRLGIASGTNPVKIEKQIMSAIAHAQWNDIGMALSFLGREICRPTNPHCRECPVSATCEWYKNNL